ncbi:MAG TPA: hypothetical protein VM054_06975 [bacterium]|nr:hypothetical protein [bacterium]
MTDRDPDTASTLLIIPRRLYLKEGAEGEHTDFELELSEPMLRALADLIQLINNNSHRFQHGESPEEGPRTQEGEEIKHQASCP